MVHEILALFTPETVFIEAPHLRPQLQRLAERGLVSRYDESPDRWCITKRGEMVRDGRSFMWRITQ